MDIKDVNNIDDLEPSLIAEAEGAQKRQVVKPAEKSAQQTPCQACKCADVAPRSKLHSFNWLADIPGGFNASDMVEVTFKNTRKGFFRNTNNLQLQCGDIVAVEASPGHDIGKVTMTGKLVALQMRRANLRPDIEFLRVFRKAKPADIEKFEAAKARENDTMIRSRKIAEDLHLNMKIGDVEYQGDGNKAIFYYIADERVDFRQLIKVLADTFKIRVEMKQIGARQEAGRIGGTGPCGRELCCATWMKNFVSVSTNAARFQDISLNPQKLAGMCAKLKCCLNYEVDDYVEASRKLPSREIVLQTQDADYYMFKSDILAGLITYSTDKNIAVNLETITAERAKEIIEMNRNGEKPLSLMKDGQVRETKKHVDLLAGGDLSRFDKAKKKKKKKPNNGNKPRPEASQQQQQQQQQPKQRPQHPKKPRRQHQDAQEQK